MPSCDLSEYSESVAADVIRLDALLNGADAPDVFWDEVLTNSDRLQLGGDRRRAWFGEPFRSAGLWARLRGVSLPRAVVEVAQQLGFASEAKAERLLVGLGESSADPTDTIENAIANGNLVLLTQPFALYYAGQKVDLPWEKKRALRNFMEELCRQAKAGKPIDNFTFNQRDRKYAVKLKSRLVNHKGFPVELGDRIVACNGQIELDFPRDQIRIFQVEAYDRIEEYIP